MTSPPALSGLSAQAAARTVHGDAASTQALIEVLMLHRIPSFGMPGGDGVDSAGHSGCRSDREVSG